MKYMIIQILKLIQCFVIVIINFPFNVYILITFDSNK